MKIIVYRSNGALMRLVNKLTRPLPDRLYLPLFFLITHKRILRLKAPRSMSEKIQWMKVNGHLERYADYVDKYSVREFVEGIIGKNYLIPLIGVWEKFDDIPFNKLPDKFVIKATHGAGYVFICEDKSLLNKNELRELINKWLNENFYTSSREPQYKLCKPRIICEKFIEDRSGSLKDYKIFCFKGQPRMVQVDFDRFSNHKRNLMDLSWRLLPVKLAHANYEKGIVRPKNFDEMLKVARKLSKLFPFVRVDLYSVEGRVYFGELTFTPGSGSEVFKPVATDYQLGDLIDLSKYKQKV